MKIEILEENVMTLDSAAKELASLYGWEKYAVHPDKIEFWADDEGDQVHGFVGCGGWAVDAETEEDLDGWNVNWCDDLDFPDIVWANDENGNLVLLHN